MKTIHRFSVAAAALAFLPVCFATVSPAATTQTAARLKSNVTPTPGWYCLIWEKMSDGRWVCRLQEKRA